MADKIKVTVVMTYPVDMSAEAYEQCSTVEEAFALDQAVYSEGELNLEEIRDMSDLEPDITWELIEDDTN